MSTEDAALKRRQVLAEREEAVKEIATHLGASIIKSPDGESRSLAYPGRWVLAALHDGRVVHFDIGYSDDKRWSVGAEYPRDSSGRYITPRDVGVVRYGEASPGEIGIAFSKRPKVIAEEIKRRFLADYAPVFLATVDALAAREGAEQRVRQVAREFADAAGLELTMRSPTDSPVIHMYREPIHGRIQYFNAQAQTVSLDLSGVPIALALELIQKATKGGAP